MPSNDELQAQPDELRTQVQRKSGWRRWLGPGGSKRLTSLAPIVATLATVMLYGCGEDDGKCSTNDECAEGQVCDGTCVPGGSSSSPDLAGLQQSCGEKECESAYVCASEVLDTADTICLPCDEVADMLSEESGMACAPNFDSSDFGSVTAAECKDGWMAMFNDACFGEGDGSGGSTGSGGDCRNQAMACSDGFNCEQVASGWECLPSGGSGGSGSGESCEGNGLPCPNPGTTECGNACVHYLACCNVNSGPELYCPNDAQCEPGIDTQQPYERHCGRDGVGGWVFPIETVSDTCLQTRRYNDGVCDRDCPVRDPDCVNCE